MKTFSKISVITLAIFLTSIFYSCSDSNTNFFKATPLPAKKMTLIGDTVGGMTNRVLICYTIDNGVKLKQIYNLDVPYRKRSEIQAYSSYNPVIRVGNNGKYFYASNMDNFYVFSSADPFASPRIITLEDLKFTKEENSFGNYIICQNKAFMELRNFANRPSQICEFDLSKTPTSALMKPLFNSDFDSGNIIIKNKERYITSEIHYLYTPAYKRRLPFSPFAPGGVRGKLQGRQECVDFHPKYGWLFSKSTVIDQTVNDDIYFVEKGLDFKRTKTRIGSYIRDDGEMYHADGKKFYSDKYKIIGKGLLAHWGYKGEIYYLYNNKLYRYSMKKKQEEIIHKWSGRIEISEFPVFSLDRKILAVLTSSKRKTVLYFFDLENETYSSIQTPQSFSNVIFVANATTDKK